jgi:hypothetical protein
MSQINTLCVLEASGSQVYLCNCGLWHRSVIIVCGTLLVAMASFQQFKLLSFERIALFSDLSSTGYGTISGIVRVLGKSAVIIEDVCVLQT